MSPSYRGRNIRGRTLAIVATVAVITGGALGARQIPNGGSPEPPGAGLANLWMDTTTSGNTCTRSSTPIAYVSNDACNSANAAYLAASAGDTILIKAGSYGSQDIDDRPSLGTSDVIFHPAPTELVTWADLNLQTHDVHIDGGDTINVNETNRLTITTDANMRAAGNLGTRNLILEDIHTRNSFNDADGITLQYSEIGPQNVCVPPNSSDLVQFWVVGTDAPTDMALLYNDIHDNNWNACDDNGDHPDALQVYPNFTTADNIQVIGNHFWHCGTQCIFVGGGSYTNTRVENNMVEESDDCNNCGVSGDVNYFSEDPGGNNTFAYNTIEGNAVLPEGIQIVGNVFLSNHSCAASTYSYNVFRTSGGSTCGSNTKRCTPLLSDGSPYSGDTDANWHISPTDTCARQAGNPSSFPAKDVDEQTRPIGTIDAGADEVGS
jgi:hypothetical protein